MKKLLFRGFLVLVVLVLVAGVALYFSLNSIVKNQVEKQGTQATGVQTQLQSVNLNPFGGQLGLNEFSLANPQGFSEAKIFKLGEADVQVGVVALIKSYFTGEEMVIRDVNLDGATVLVELDGLNLNTMKLLENIQGSGEADDAGSEGEQPTPSPEGETQGFKINNLNITNTKLIGRIKLPGGIEQDVDIQLADINEKDIQGVELSDVIGFAVRTIMVNASREIAQIAPNLEQLGSQVETITNQTLEGVGKKLDEALPGAGVGEAAKKIGGREADKVLKGIFGDKKKKKPRTSLKPRPSDQGQGGRAPGVEVCRGDNSPLRQGVRTPRRLPLRIAVSDAP